MEACSFDESNGVLGKPDSMSDAECQALSVWRGTCKGLPLVVSCWKLTTEEWEEIRKTGRIWLQVIGESMPPVALTTQHPWRK